MTSNTTPDPFDAIVIGAGMAGIPLALRLAFKGRRTALIERAQLGGTCLNRGCIPTKTMIASARVAHQARQAARWGVLTEGVRVDLGKVVARKDELVTSIRAGAERNVERNDNVTLIRGDARFVGERTLEVAGRTVSAEQVFINTGTRNTLPDVEGLADVPYLDSTRALELTTLPAHLLIIGGGYIGVEFAQMFRRFGSEVTVVQRAPQLLPNEDEDVAEALRKALEAEGITILTGAVARAAQPHPDGVRLVALHDGEELALDGSHLMIAAGRTPNTDTLNLDSTGVELDAQGFIRVNDRLETSAAGVWALGDVRGGMMFTHTARDDARIVYENVVKGADLSIRGRVVPYAVFSDPQLGRVGMSEKQARAAGCELKVGSYPAAKIAKARALGETHGVIKVIADAATDRLLGAAALLPDGAEVVHELIAAITLGARYTDLAEMIHIHPTVAEGVSSALGGVHRAASDAA